MDFFTEHQELLLTIGAVLVVLIVGYAKFRYEIMFLFSKRETEGTITNWMSAMEDGKRYFYPMIEYYTLEQNKITFRAEERSEGSPMYEPGTKVIVKYLPKKPDVRKVVYPS